MGTFSPTNNARQAEPDFGGNCWVIVLAGGTGERMRPFISRWLNEDRPKQYCTFIGRRSMLQHTLDRAAALASRERTALVIGRGQEGYLEGAIEPRSAEIVLQQPEDRGTAAAIFRGLAHVLERDPCATVVVFPSDHFVHPEEVFLGHVARACAAVERSTDRIAMLGAVALRPETDYGWIVPAEEAEPAAPDGALAPHWRIKSFHEKPSALRAEELRLRGCLWNTMVIACKARTLWSLGARLLPEMARSFGVFRRALRAIAAGEVGPEHEMIALRHIYAPMRPADFSKDFLERASPWSVVFPMDRMHWCDWGRPGRIVESLDRLGLTPAFARDWNQSVAEAACPLHYGESGEDETEMA